MEKNPDKGRKTWLQSPGWAGFFESRAFQIVLETDAFGFGTATQQDREKRLSQPSLWIP
jgi:hypothetical protein